MNTIYYNLNVDHFFHISMCAFMISYQYVFLSGTDKHCNFIIQKFISSKRSWYRVKKKLARPNIPHSFNIKSQDCSYVCFSFCLSYQKLQLFHCITDIVMCRNPSNVRMNMSLPVSPCSSPLRQYRQSNRSCLASPPHPAYSAGAANYSPINNALYLMRPSSCHTDPWLEISQLKTQTFDSPRRL